MLGQWPLDKFQEHSFVQIYYGSVPSCCFKKGSCQLLANMDMHLVLITVWVKVKGDTMHLYLYDRICP